MLVQVIRSRSSVGVRKGLGIEVARQTIWTVWRVGCCFQKTCSGLNMCHWHFVRRLVLYTTYAHAHAPKHIQTHTPRNAHCLPGSNALPQRHPIPPTPALASRTVGSYRIVSSRASIRRGVNALTPAPICYVFHAEQMRATCSPNVHIILNMC